MIVFLQSLEAQIVKISKPNFQLNSTTSSLNQASKRMYFALKL